MDTNSGTTQYVGTSTYSSLAAGNSYYNLTFNGSGGSWTHTSTLDVNGDLTITAGTLASSGQNVTLAGSFSNAGTYTSGSNTFTFDGTSGTKTVTSGGTSFNNLTLNDGGGSLTVELQDALDVNGNLTITGGGLDTKSGANYAITLAGNFSNADTFTARSGTVTLDGTASGKTITSGGGSFFNLTVNGSGGVWTLQDAMDVNGSITISAGTLDASASNCSAASCAITVAGSWSDSGNTFTERTGTVTFDGSGSSNTITEGGSFYNLVFNGTGTWDAGALITVGNSLTLTAGTLDLSTYNLAVTGTFTTGGTLRLRGTETSVTSPSNLTTAGTVAYDNTATVSSFLLGNNYYNLTLGGSGTVALAAALDTNGSLTVASGATLDHNGYDITIGGDLSNSGTISNPANRTYTLDGTTQTFNPSNITFNTLTVSGSSGTASLGSNFTLSNLLSIAAGRTLAILGFTLTSSGSITNSGTITEGAGHIADASSSFYIADSSFDIDDAISLGVDKVYISLTDEDSNKDGTAADTLTGTVVSCATDSETVTLTETGNATEVFRNASGLTTAVYDGAATNNDGTLECADGVTITATFTDPQDSGDTQSDTSSATADTIPTAPSGFAGTAASSTSITWTWTDNSSNETGFKLYNSSNTLIATISTANTTSYTETGLTKGTSYTRKLVAYNNAGNSSYSGSASVTTPAEPTAPSSFSGVVAGTTSITWSWTDNSNDELTWVLQDSGGTTVTTITSTTVSATGGSISYTETGLTPGTSYTRKMAARNDDGTSTATSTATVTTTPSTAPGSFSLLSPASSALITTNLPTFSFQKSIDVDEDVVSYTLTVDSLTFTINPNGPTQSSDLFTTQYFNENDGNPSNDTISVTLKAGATSTLPLDDGEHSWKVKATDGQGNTRTTSTRNFTIDTAKPTFASVSISSPSTTTYDLPTTDTTPTITIKVVDALRLDDLVVTLDEANKVLGVITSYTTRETTTYTLSGTSQTITHAPKLTLEPGTTYRLTLKLTDQAGNSATRQSTLGVLTAAQQAAQEIAELDADTAPTEEIIEKLREVGPKSPVSVPELIAKAVLRREKQAEIFRDVLTQQEELLARVSNSNSFIGRVVKQVLAFGGRFIDEVTRLASISTQRIVAWWQSATTGTLARVQFMFERGSSLAGVLSGATSQLSNQANVSVIALSQRFNIPLPEVPTLDVGSVVQTARNQGEAVKTNTQQASGALSFFWQRGRDTRVRVGLKNRQLIGSRILTVWNVSSQRVKNLTLRARAIYEIALDKEPTRISNLRVAQLTPRSAVVEWDTNHLTRLGKVNYGTSVNHTYDGEAFEESGLRDHHQVTLHDLQPATTYYFEVMNQNGGYVFDAYYALTTPPENEGLVSEELVPQVAVVVGDGPVNVYESPDPGSEVIKTLDPGEERRALLRKDGWVSILLIRGQEAWVPADRVELHDQVNDTGVER
jgi:hypothetical protein